MPQIGYTLKLDSDNRLQLYLNNIQYKDCPYIIIQYGLSNYLELEGTPSLFYKKKGDCNITESEFNQLVVNFNEVKSRLSVDQQAAESNLIKLYNYKLLLEKGIKAQSVLTYNEEELLASYNALYDFRYESININQKLNDMHYQPIFNSLNQCINSISNRLAMNIFLKPVFIVLDKNISNINNADLVTLRGYVDNTKNYPFIVKSNFNMNALTTLNAAESEIYQLNFDPLIDRILSTNIISASVRLDMVSLIEMKNQFDNCLPCQTASKNAEKYFNELVNTEELRRSQILETVSYSNEIYHKGTAALQKLKLGIEIETDTLSGNSTFPRTISVDSLESILDSLITIKNELNSNLSLLSFSQQNRLVIDDLISKSNNIILLINKIVDTQLQPIFDNRANVFINGKFEG